MMWRRAGYVVGALTVCLGFSMAVPLAVGLWLGDGSAAALAESMAVTLGAGVLVLRLSSPLKGQPLTHREGMVIVSVSWAAAGLFGSFPFYFGGIFPCFADALFESVSGFTTTGSSLLSDIESVPKALLLWRSLIQWLGGMGIIVLSLAILPFLGVGGMQLYKAEVPSPVPDKLTPRIRETARLLWKVYGLFSALEVLLLALGGMGLFDAVCHAFTTMPTGGFSTLNLSVGQMDSAYFEMVILFFMLLAGINFSLHFQLLNGRPRALWNDPECRFYATIVAGATLVVVWNVWGSVYPSLWQALRFGSFQVGSIVTTTGYVTADYEKWPALSQLVLILCMFLGASAGSTGGGIKCVRLMLLLKYCYRELFRLVHPHGVFQVKLRGKVVPEDILRSVCGFFLLYVGLFVCSAVLLAAMGVDLLTCLAAVAATIGNIGPGIGQVGPMDNFGGIPYLGKWLLVWCMLLGRLEINTVLILLVPEFWRR